MQQINRPLQNWSYPYSFLIIKRLCRLETGFVFIIFCIAFIAGSTHFCIYDVIHAESRHSKGNKITFVHIQDIINQLIVLNGIFQDTHKQVYQNKAGPYCHISSKRYLRTRMPFLTISWQEILRKELPNFAPMSRDDLIAFIKLYATEQSAFSASCKEYQKKVEERLEAAKKDEEELKSLKIYVDKCQEQLKLLTEENDKTIGLNNDLKDKVAELEKEVVELRAFKESVDSSQLGMDPKQKIIEQLQSDVKKKDELILNYEKKFEEFEEDTQDATGKFKAAEDRVVKLEKQVEKQKREMEEIRKENENLAFEKASEASTFSQDRIEFKKAASIAEKTISHLTKEKNSLEAKLALLQEKVEKSTKKGLAKETQTETSFTEDKGNHITGDEKSRLKSKLLQKEEELYTANNYSASLLQELKKMQDKFNQLQARDVGIERLLDEKVKMYQQLEREKNALLEENIELRKRRELAVSEITKLTQQISRKNTKPREAGRHLSEAVRFSFLRIGKINRQLAQHSQDRIRA
eukprot:TRINITY_DN71082_c0_g1_i1.p1 TRINITY_DN71082_c0_g1~~TRINITY_DN71082_c0_g1_i1.p1  ORF type:complete len:523 (+),score=83.11 TRINITY_DN71082_c0_g1_i1:725-2293(+)